MKGRRSPGHPLTWVLVEDVRPLPEKEKKQILKKTPSTTPPLPQQMSSSVLPPPMPVLEKRGRGRPKTKPDVLYHRAPTAYNLFVKSMMPRVKAELPGASSKERMQRCAALWKEQKSDAALVNKG